MFDNVRRTVLSTIWGVVLALSPCMAVANGAADEPTSLWPMKGGDSQHSGRVDIALGPRFSVEWQRAVGSYDESGPVTDRFGNVYIGTSTGLAKYAADGALGWSCLFGRMYCTPTVGPDDTVYAAPLFLSSPSLSGLYAFNSDGSVKWRFTTPSTGDRVLSSPTIGSDGTVYFAVCNEGIYALNPNGTQKWFMHDSQYYIGTPALSQDGTRLYVDEDWGSLKAIDTSTGSVVWARGSGMRSTPSVLADGTIVVASGGSVFGYEPDGDLRWTFAESGAKFFASPCVASDGTILITSNDNYNGGNNKLFALRQDGTLRWSRSDPGLGGASPILDSLDNIYVNGQQHFTSWTIDGDLRWDISGISGGLAQPGVSIDGSVYCCNGANLVKLAPVPEPSSFILLGIGAVSLLACAWRRRRKLHNLRSMILAAIVVLAAGSAQADVFNMGGMRNPTTGTWTGAASLEFVTVGDPGNAADTALRNTRLWCRRLHVTTSASTR